MSDTYQSELDSNPGMAQAMDQSSAPSEPPADNDNAENPSGVLEDSGGTLDPGGAGTSDAMLAKIFGQMAENEKQAQTRLDKLQGEEMDLRHGAIDAAKERAAQIERDRLARPKPPQLQSVPKPPQQDLAEGWQGFMLAATAIGALAGTRARNGTTLSLNAFSAAIQGFKNGQAEVFKQKSDEWKQIADQTISDNQEKLQQYSAIWKDEQMNLDQKMEEYKIVASTYHDQLSYNLADQRNVTLLGQNYQKDVQNTMRIQQQAANLAKTNLAIADKMAKDKREAETRETMAQSLADNSISPDEISARGDRNEIYGIAKKKYGVNIRDKEQDWLITKKKITVLNGPAMTVLLSLEGSFRPEFQQLIDMGKQLKLSGYPLVSKAQLNAWSKLENHDPKTAEGRRNILASAYMAKAAHMEETVAKIASGGYAPTESAFGLAHNMFQTDWNVPTLEKVLDTMDKAIEMRITAIKDQDRLTSTQAGAAAGGSGYGNRGPAPNAAWGNMRVSE